VRPGASAAVRISLTMIDIILGPQAKEAHDAKRAEIRRLLRGDLEPARSVELMAEMRAAGLPT